MNPPNMSNRINRNIAQSEIDGGIFLDKLLTDRVLKVQTRNTLYTIHKISDNEYTIQGHSKYCPTPVKCNIHGSTRGGSMLKVDFIGRGMQLEFSTPEYECVTTSTVQEITEKYAHRL